MQPLKLRNWHFLMLIKGRSSLIWKCGILRNWHLKLDNMPKSALKDAFLQWHFLRFIYFNFEKLTTFKTTIRNKLLRNSSWIRLCLGLPLPHHVIFISNIIWDHVADIFCVLIFPLLFSNGRFYDCIGCPFLCLPCRGTAFLSAIAILLGF